VERKKVWKREMAIQESTLEARENGVSSNPSELFDNGFGRLSKFTESANEK
jgi:hypothetical protein